MRPTRSDALPLSRPTGPSNTLTLSNETAVGDDAKITILKR